MSILNRRLVITTILYIAIIVVGIMFLILPLIDKVQARQAALQTEFQAFKAASSKLDQLNQLSKSQSDIDAAKILVGNAVPPTLEQDKLILSLEKVVGDAGLGLTTLSVSAAKAAAKPVAPAAATTPAPAAATGATTPAATTKTKAPATATLPVSITVNGDYAKVTTLLDTLEKLDRILSIDSVAISNTSSATGSSGVEATIAVTAYGQGGAL